MINKEDLIEFVNRVESRVGAVAKLLDWEVNDPNFSGYSEETVDFEGWEYWNYGGKQHHHFYADWKYFLCSDEEFEEMLREETAAKAVRQLEVERAAKAERLEKERLKEALEKQKAELKDEDDYQIFLKLRDRYKGV